MSVILQANYRTHANPTVSVAAPNDGKGDPWFYNRLALDIHSHAQAGFKYFQLPPSMITIGGPSADSDGYGVWWEYDHGTENSPTRFGYTKILRRLTAMGWANGIYPLTDWVPHQRYGGDNGVYRYDSYGGKGMGRFPKDPQDFRKMGSGPDLAPQDNVPDKFWDIAFGDELSPIDDLHRGYSMEQLEKAGHWIYRCFQLAGCRSDDTKGQAVAAVQRWSQYGEMQGKPIIGEYAEGDPNTLSWWLSQVPGNCQTFDFGVKYAIRDMCNGGSKYDMTQLVNMGLMAKGSYWAMRSVNFVENADSDTNGFGAVVYNKMLGYAWILTSEGWPCVYYRDYSTDRDCYGLKPFIDNLIWVHETLASGDTWWRHSEYQFVVYERQGHPGLLVGLNNDIWGGWKTVYVATSFGGNQKLHDYSGHAGDIWTDGNGGVTLSIPPNHNGLGYVTYSRDGFQNLELAQASHPAVQLFEGAPDLLDGPALPLGILTGEIFVEKGTDITLAKESGAGVDFSIFDANDRPIIPRGGWKGRSDVKGWHAIKAFSPAGKSVPYEVTATYQAPKTLSVEEL